jgi:adenine-specific DNA-methyltransferase
MANGKKKSEKTRTVETLTHEEASRKNIPTAEYQSVLSEEQERPIRVTYDRGVAGLESEKGTRNRDLDPQLVWRGKDEQDWSELVTQAPPIYIQEKVHPKVLIDDLLRRSKADAKADEDQFDLFADFNGVPEGNAKTEFYQHDANWTNRMILGDSLQVMASLAEREGLRGQVQCIYIDPPYGIKFNSNFQWSTTSRDVKDGNVEHITREPEQVKAFRDTWRDGIHSYLTYLRDRLTVARDLLTESGSIVVQIGQDNSHLLRNLLDEVFGKDNFVSQIIFSKTAGATSEFLAGTYDVLVFYAKSRERLKFRQPLVQKQVGGAGGGAYKRLRLDDLSERSLTTAELNGTTALPLGSRVFRIDNLTSQSVGPRQGRRRGFVVPRFV